MEKLILEKGCQAVVPCVATIGMFDGVHKGHRFVLKQVCDYAKAQGLASCAITFDRHPREVVQSDWHPKLLTTFEERMQLLEQTGIDRCVVVPFTKVTAGLSARDFMQLMADRLGVKVLLTGYDNRFGHDRSASFEDYVSYGLMEVKRLPSLSPNGEGNQVSSSMVRKLLEEGNVREAADALCYPYQITGTVVKGEHVGTKLGFPTANLQLIDPHKLIPAPGVYAVRVTVNGPLGTCDAFTKATGRLKEWSMVNGNKGMMNIGTRPTFGEHQQTLEVHILDFKGDLYDKEVKVEFIERLRDEQRFESKEKLTAQLLKDEMKIKNLKI